MEPIILGSQNPIWFMVVQSLGTFLGIVIVAIITWKIANLRINAQMDLKREETKLFLERALVELKLGLLKDVEWLQTKFSSDESLGKEYRDKLISVRDRIGSYVAEENLYEIAHKGVKEFNNARKIKKEDITEERNSDIITEELETSRINLLVALRAIHKKLSKNLGFKSRLNSKYDVRVDEVTKDFVFEKRDLGVND